MQGLVARYEALSRQQGQEKELHTEELAKRDIEIGLLNASLSNLNAKVSWCVGVCLLVYVWKVCIMGLCVCVFWCFSF